MFLNFRYNVSDNIISGALSVALAIKTQIEEYKPMIKILKNILNPGMKQRHWDTFASETGKLLLLYFFN